MPVIDMAHAEEMNLSVIKRIDPDVEQVRLPVQPGSFCLEVTCALTLSSCRATGAGWCGSSLLVPHGSGEPGLGKFDACQLPIVPDNSRVCY